LYFVQSATNNIITVAVFRSGEIKTKRRLLSWIKDCRVNYLPCVPRHGAGHGAKMLVTLPGKTTITVEATSSRSLAVSVGGGRRR